MAQILDNVLNVFQKHPDKVAYQVKNSIYTYTEFENRINAIEQYISKNEFKDQFYIGIDASEIGSFETYCQIFACMFAGKCFVPINLTYPADRIDYVLENTGIKTVFIHNESPELKTDFTSKNNIQFVNTLLLSKETNSKLENRNFPDDQFAYILFTSGSTGFPKGVPITRGDIFGFVQNYISLGYNVDYNDRFIQMFDLTFDLSIFCYLVPALYGASVHPIQSKGIKLSNTFNIMLDNNITVALLVPSVLSFLKPYYEEIELLSLRYLFFCGEAMSNDLTLQFSKCVPNARIVNFYGPTEATIFCIYYEWKKELYHKKHHNGSVSIGKPFPNMFGIIINDKNEMTGTKEVGELCLTGNQLTPGYFKNEEKNKEVFLNFEYKGEQLRLYRTGDLAFYDDDNDIMFGGRKDFQVKIQGFRVELGEIEHNIRKIVCHNDVIVVAVTNANSNSELHVFLVGTTEQIDLTRNKLPGILPKYMLPSDYHIVKSFPLNNNGKIDRKKLKESIS